MSAAPDLEREVRQLKARMRAVEAHLHLVGPERPAARPGGAGSSAAPPPGGFAPPASPTPRAAPSPRQAVRHGARPATPAPASPRDVEDLVGGRVLAWVGGVAVCVGLAFLLAVAISRGWIDEGARVGLGAAVSALFLVAGVWLHERRDRTQASLVAVGTGIAGLFATVTVGTALYEVLPVGVGLAAAAAVGIVATALAVRWSAQPVAALGIGGALVAPLLVGAPHDVAPLIFVGIAAAAATAVVTWRRWTVLVAAGPALALPQWLTFLAERQPSVPGALLVLVAFGGLGAAAAIGHDVRLRTKGLRFAPAFLLALNALVLAGAGWLALGRATTGALWLVALALAHGIPAVAARGRASDELRLFALTLAVVLLDAAVAVIVSSPLLSIGWSVVGVGFAVLARRRDLLGAERQLATAGLGVHVALGLVRALAGEDGAASSAPSATALLALGGLTAACLASARLQDERHQLLRMALDAVGLAALAGLTAQLASGPALVVAWAGEAAALAVLARRSRDRVAELAGLAFLALAGVHALAVEAPLSSLVEGPPNLGFAAIALGVLTLAAARAARSTREPQLGMGLSAVAAATGLYLASTALVAAFQPSAGAFTVTLFDLGVRQEGQLVLSAFWAATGVAALLAGLRAGRRELRLGALVVLGIAVGKVFLFDLATLTAGYRVASFLVLGLLLLGAGFAYERLRGGRPAA